MAQLNVIACESKDCGLTMLAVNGSSIRVCPTCHSPARYVGKASLNIGIESPPTEAPTEEQVHHLLGTPVPEV